MVMCRSVVHGTRYVPEQGTWWCQSVVHETLVLIDTGFDFSERITI